MRKYDAIVIGAGVIGCSTACSLASAGYSVLIIERGEPACGASGGNLGQLSLSDRWEPWHMKLARKTIDFYKNDLSREFDIEFRQDGGSIMIENDAQMQAARETVEELAASGVKACIYTGREIGKIEPKLDVSKLQGILYCPEEGKINPFAVTLALLNRAQRAGAALLKQTAVTGFDMADGRITAVKTDKGDYTARWIVNCTGPRAGFVSQLAGFQLDALRYHKGTAFVTQPVEPVIHSSLTGGGFLMKGSGPMPQRRIGFCAVQTVHGSIIIGQTTEECETDDREMNAPAICLTARRFLGLLPSLEDLQVVRAWAAVTTYTKDELPVFGFSSKCSNMLTVAGFKGAFTTCYAIGELAKDTLEGHMDPDYACCSPDRVVQY